MKRAVLVLAACGSSSEPPPIAKPASDAAVVVPPDAYVKVTGFASAGEAAKAFVLAVEEGDEGAMRSMLVGLSDNEHYYDCSKRKDYHLDTTSAKAVREALAAGREARKVYQKQPKAKLATLGFTETKRMARVVDEISGVCRVRIPLEVVLGNLEYELVDGKQHTRYTAAFIFVFADGVYRINTVTL